MPDITLRVTTRDRIVSVNQKFMQSMVNRLIVGFYRYEKEKPPSERSYLKRLKAKIRQYESSGNRELLIDAANYCMREFDHPSSDGTHFTVEESNGRNRHD